MTGWQLSWADKELKEDQRCRFTFLRSKTTISDNALVKSRTNSFRSTMKLTNAISHYALASSRANNSDAPRLKLRTNNCHSRLRRNTAGKWHTTRQHKQKGRIQVDTFDLDWSAQLLCMTFTWSKVQILRVMRVREYHSLHSMHSWWKTQEFSKIESEPNYTTAAHAFVKATLRLGLRAPFVARKNRVRITSWGSNWITCVASSAWKFFGSNGPTSLLFNKIWASEG